jgi:hypothetical protein
VIGDALGIEVRRPVHRLAKSANDYTHVIGQDELLLEVSEVNHQGCVRQGNLWHDRNPGSSALFGQHRERYQTLAVAGSSRLTLPRYLGSGYIKSFVALIEAMKKLDACPRVRALINLDWIGTSALSRSARLAPALSPRESQVAAPGPLA